MYGLVFLANRRRIRKVNLQEQFIMAYGGLRGAVGFSLVEMIEKEVIPPKQMFVTTTLAVVMFTIFFQVIVYTETNIEFLTKINKKITSIFCLFFRAVQSSSW